MDARDIDGAADLAEWSVAIDSVATREAMPERRLFAAVLLQATVDVRTGSAYNAVRAFEWVAMHRSMFVYYAEALGLDSRRLRAAFMAKFAHIVEKRRRELADERRRLGRPPKG